MFQRSAPVVSRAAVPDHQHQQQNYSALDFADQPVVADPVGKGTAYSSFASTPSG
ncbi:hypothetical protein [Trichloromonas acetexigens]|uniref:hypothetical protein n=1 Tax=Trichloromonas acetexigens TaxID=38815 RepID=UPI0014796EBC|nr:hypothetical protein [Desulfuromonas acetexigens]